MTQGRLCCKIRDCGVNFNLFREKDGEEEKSQMMMMCPEAVKEREKTCRDFSYCRLMLIK